MWAAGQSDIGNAAATLAFHYNDPCFGQTPTPTTPTATIPPVATPTNTPALTSTPTSAITSTTTNIPTRTTTRTSTPTSVATSVGSATVTVQPSVTRSTTATHTVVATLTTTSTTTPPTTTATTTATSTLTGTPTICQIQFVDVPATNTFYANVRCLACRGIIGGYPCGGTGEPCNGNNDPYFRPGNLVTRGQLAKIVSNSAGFSDPPIGQTFEDVLPGTAFYTFTERLASRGVMGGYQCGIDPGEPCGPANLPYFRPSAGASRGQLTKIVSNAAGFIDPAPSTFTFADVPVGSTFHIYVERLLLNRPGVMEGYPCGGVNPQTGQSEPCDGVNRPYFRPGNSLSRGQTSKIVGNTFFPGCNPPAR